MCGLRRCLTTSAVFADIGAVGQVPPLHLLVPETGVGRVGQILISVRCRFHTWRPVCRGLPKDLMGELLERATP